jgi:hypothetical protein
MSEICAYFEFVSCRLLNLLNLHLPFKLPFAYPIPTESEGWAQLQEDPKMYPSCQSRSISVHLFDKLHFELVYQAAAEGNHFQ